MKKVVICYVPVIHEGYIRFWQVNRKASHLFILGDEFISQFRPLVKDIRKLDPMTAKTLVESLKIFIKVEILSPAWLKVLASQAGLRTIFPDDYLHRQIACNFSEEGRMFSPVFLMRDSEEVQKKADVLPAVTVTDMKFHSEIMAIAEDAAAQSSDWWRHVGAAVVEDHQLQICAYNNHLPTEYEPYFSGDPRSWFSKGVQIELSTALHAEAAVIAEAARLGIALSGADLYVTDFPCPSCSKLVASSGISRLFFRKGYSTLLGEEIIRSRGIEIIQVV